jgi:hypothetical protein
MVKKRYALFGWIALKVGKLFVRRKLKAGKKRFGR